MSLTELHMVVPLKQGSNRQDKPVSKLPSFLIILVILQYTGLEQSVDFLQDSSHESRSYAYYHLRDLKAMLKPDRILTDLKLSSEKALTSVLRYCGGPSMVLQMHQLLNKTSRTLCKKKRGFQGLLHKHDYEINSSETTLEFNQELVQMRFLG